ncbi:MAG: transposase [Bacteroidota bacterium]
MSTTSPRRLRPRRRYATDFKRARVKDFESGTFSIGQLSRLYDIHPATLYNWVKKFTILPAQNAVIMEVPNSQTAKVKQLEERVALLERALGNKQIELDLTLAKMVILEEQGIDVKKKPPPPSRPPAVPKLPTNE